jgi:hypothetical protein
LSGGHAFVIKGSVFTSEGLQTLDHISTLLVSILRARVLSQVVGQVHATISVSLIQQRKRRGLPQCWGYPAYKSHVGPVFGSQHRLSTLVEWLCALGWVSQCYYCIGGYPDFLRDLSDLNISRFHYGLHSPWATVPSSVPSHNAQNLANLDSRSPGLSYDPEIVIETSVQAWPL